MAHMYVSFIYPLWAACVNINCGTRVRYQWYIFRRQSAPQTPLSKVRLQTIVYFLLGISLASNCSWPTFRNPLSVPSSKAGCTVNTQPLKMELIQGSETSANYNLTPGKYPKENIQYSNHGESLKSRKIKDVIVVMISYSSGAQFFLKNLKDSLKL